MPSSTINQLSTLVASLHRDREQHVAAIADIDNVFSRLGVSAGAAPRRGRRPGRPKGSARASVASGGSFKKRRRRPHRARCRRRWRGWLSLGGRGAAKLPASSQPRCAFSQAAFAPLQICTRESGDEVCGASRAGARRRSEL
jgi:hypothetical protein